MESFFDYPNEPEPVQPQELVFLADWGDEKWERLLEHTELRRFRAGDQVIDRGDVDRTLYVIVDGRLEVRIPQGSGGRLRGTQVRGPGAVVGEQAFLDGRPRSASLVALGDGELLSMSLEAFEVFAAHEPDLARDILFDLARTLSVKLRQANQFISDRLK